MMPLPIIQSLWIGGALSKVEQLCVASFMKNGHEFHLYTYDRVEGIPKGTKVLDANLIIPKDEIFIAKRSYALFADWFRWKLLYEQGNVWVDMDMVCMQPFDFKDKILFGEEAGDHVGVAVLMFPKGHEICKKMLKRCESPHEIDSDDPLKTRYKKIVRKYLQGNKKEKQGWGDRGGPRGFKKVLAAYPEDLKAKPFTFFYPILACNGKHIFDETLKNDVSLFHDTHAIHLWNDVITKSGLEKNSDFPKESLFEQLKSRYLGA